MVCLNSSFLAFCFSEKFSIASLIISLTLVLVTTSRGAKLIGVGPEVMEWIVTTIVSLNVASCEVGSIGVSSTLSFDFSTTMIGMELTTSSALATTTIGLETSLLGLVFSASA